MTARKKKEEDRLLIGAQDNFSQTEAETLYGLTKNIPHAMNYVFSFLLAFFVVLLWKC